MARRRDPSVLVKQQVLMEAGFMYGNPCCRHILTLELHHIDWVKEGGGNEASNLLALCANCYGLHTRGEIPKEAIRHWKGMLVALNHAFDREGLDLLLYLYQTRGQGPGSGMPIWYSSDGLLRFARLIAAGLVVIASRRPEGTLGNMETYRPDLTAEGLLLVEAWLTGDEKRYRQALLRGMAPR